MDVTVDTSQFDAMCDELAKAASAPHDRVLREEIGRVLSAAIENTEAASISSIKNYQQSRTFSELPPTLYTPKRPGRRQLNQRGKVVYNMKYHYPNVLWQRIQKARSTDVAKKLAARGLAKQSWYLLGQLLGVKVDAPAYVKRAIATTGKQYPQDEQVRAIHSNGSVAYELRNSQPTVNALDGQIALQRAITGRVSYFFQNIAHDVFSNLQQIAKKYPGVT